MDFSWSLTINGNNIQHFGNMVFSHSISGYGTSGVISKRFEFDIYDENEQYAEAILDNVPVTLTCAANAEFTGTIPTYYIMKRTVSDKVCHFICYDKLAMTDQRFDTSALTFTDGKISIVYVLSAVFYQCGIDEYGYSDNTGADSIYFTEEQLKNCTCRDILEDVSAAMCGVWICDASGMAVLSTFGRNLNGIIYSTDYAEIEKNGIQKITALVMTNSDSGEQFVYQTGEYGITLDISTPFACSALASAVWSRVENYTYTAWNCKAAKVPEFMLSTVFIRFGDTTSYPQLSANKVQLKIASTGVYFSGGNPPQDKEYKPYLDREKISVAKNIGNTAIARSGRIIFRNLNSG
ncbi:MAG: hypothetical protein ACI4JF_07435, partial [Oscillospiraceae bacterium]